MNVVGLKAFIEKFVRLTEAEWQLIGQNFIRNEFLRDQMILEEGKICCCFYFLETGMIRFFSTIEGNDITRTFMLAPYCFTSKTSFRKQAPSSEGIQALENSVVWQISFHQFKNLEEINVWNVFIRKLLNEIQEFSEKLYLETKTLTAEARYLKLFQDYPSNLIHKIPLKHLSSFLGVAPQSLSRIRKKMYRDQRN